jgi:hypothetical protein
MEGIEQTAGGGDSLGIVGGDFTDVGAAQHFSVDTNSVNI